MLNRCQPEWKKHKQTILLSKFPLSIFDHTSFHTHQTIGSISEGDCIYKYFDMVFYFHVTFKFIITRVVFLLPPLCKCKKKFFSFAFLRQDRQWGYCIWKEFKTTMKTYMLCSYSTYVASNSVWVDTSYTHISVLCGCSSALKKTSFLH